MIPRPGGARERCRWARRESRLSVFKPQYIDPEALVFATRGGTPFSRRNLPNRELAPTCEKLGIEGVIWHWLRHANATLLDAVGTLLGTVQALLGHSSGRGHAGDLCALRASGRARRGGKGRGTSDWSQMDPSCSSDQSGEYPNWSNWSGREDLNLRPPGPEPDFDPW
jgi:hypothetical protein